MPFKKMESLPQRQQGVRETANLRMKLMAAPYCPVVDDPDKPGYTGEPNCQTEMNSAPGWWKICEERGHEPYFRIRKRIVKEPVKDNPDDPELITGYREKEREERKLNVVRVAISTRFHSGRGEAISMGLKGRKTLTDMGYKEKCEFRNCELDAKLKSKYGNFCGARHARLIGADVEVTFLTVNKLGRISKVGENELKNLNLDYEGFYVLQAPPDLEGMG